MNRKLLVAGFCGGSLGVLLSHIGVGFDQWEFWAAQALFVAYGWNLAWD